MARFAAVVLTCFLSLGSLARAEAPLPADRATDSSPVPDTAAPAGAPARWEGFNLEMPAFDAALRVRGLLQVDGVFFANDRSGQSDRFEIRRARIALSGHVSRWFAFRIEPQFVPGNVVLLDGWVELRALDWLSLRAGKMKTPAGLEMLQPITALILPERGLTTALVPIRDLGAQLGGFVADGILTYMLGIYDGAPDGVIPEGNLGDSMDLAARLFVHPFHATSIDALKKLGVGMAGSWGQEHGTDSQSGLGRYITGTRAVFASYEAGVRAQGVRYRVNPQASWYWGPLGLLGEYVLSAQRLGDASASRVIGNQAWLAGASYVLTQEDAGFGDVLPARSWGALELSARYSELRFDGEALRRDWLVESSPQRAQTWGLSLSYWAPAVVRAQLAFEQTRFVAGQGSARPEENAFYLRMQLAL